MGIPEGCPVSPTLYSIFMDKLLERLEGTSADGATDSAYLALCFADDVVSTSRTAGGATKVAGRSEQLGGRVLYALVGGKVLGAGGDVTASGQSTGTEVVFKLASKALTHVETVEYLGITVCATRGLVDDKCGERIKAAPTLV